MRKGSEEGTLIDCKRSLTEESSSSALTPPQVVI